MDEITMDCFGVDCPANWQEIADYLMEKIRAELPEGEADDHVIREIVDRVWEEYWGDYHAGELSADAPKPTGVWEDKT